MLENIGSGLLAYYKFDTASGVTFDSFDSENLVNVNGVVSGIGKIDEAAVFVNASNQELQGSGSNVFDFDGTGDFTFVCWALVNSLNPPGSDQLVFSKSDSTTNNRQYILFFDASTDQFRALISENGVTFSADVSPTTNIAANVFHFVVLEYDASEKRLTLTQNNGTGGDTATAVAANAAIFQGTRVFSIGFGITGADPAWDGKIDEFLVYERLLTSTEKTDVYNAGAGIDLIPFLFPPPVHSTSGFVGGYIEGIPPGAQSGFIGGFAFGIFQFGPGEEASGTPQIGGYLEGFTSVPDVSGQIGGFTSSLQQFGPDDADGILPRIGGHIFGVQAVPFGGIPGNKIGGLVLSIAGQFNQNNQFFGGYTTAPGQANSGQFGGFLQAQPLTPAPTTRPAIIGGMASGLFEPDPGIFGGWTFGRPADAQFIEQHSRTLVKVRSRDVVDQGLDLDSQLLLQQRAEEEFNAKFIFFDTAEVAQFNAKIVVEAFKLLPSGVCTIIAGTNPDGVTQVTVTGSGILNEPDTFFTSAAIDFGEPYGFGGPFGGGGVGNPQVGGSVSGFNFSFLLASGFPVSASHDYPFPGKYIITVSFIDNTGQIHMEGITLNTIGSGAIDSVPGTPVEGIDYPALDISGLPRIGVVPPTVFVDFDMRASGIGIGPVEAKVAALNTTPPTTDQFLHWNFANGNISTIKQPFSNYPNPGRFIPVARYQFIHPSGELIAASGGPPGGSGSIFGDKPIWISDSLLIGFNR